MASNKNTEHQKLKQFNPASKAYKYNFVVCSGRQLQAPNSSSGVSDQQIEGSHPSCGTFLSNIPYLGCFVLSDRTLSRRSHELGLKMNREYLLLKRMGFGIWIYSQRSY